MKERVVSGHQFRIEMAEDKILDSITTLDQVYHLLDNQTTDEMHRNSYEIIQKYSKNPNFTTWDFEQLKNQYGMDVFVIDDTNTVIHSSFIPDIDLNFNVCCSGFAKLLTERRLHGDFIEDGIDLQQVTGELKKFSYTPTPDRKYLIELTVSIEKTETFQQFDFSTTIDSLEKKYDAINSIRVYTSAGFLLGAPEDEVYVKEIESQRKSVLRKAIRTKETQEFKELVGNRQLTNRFIPYTAKEKRGLSTDRVVEIIYNEDEFTALLKSYQKQFLVQLAVIFIASILLSAIIARLVAEPIYLAFHDSLTGLKNRAAFTADLQRRLSKKDNKNAMILIDLDNFKQVNDTMGHSEGDKILRLAASTIQNATPTKDIAARIGGDEFVVLCSNKAEVEIRTFTTRLLHEMNNTLLAHPECQKLGVSISVGVAFADNEDSSATLYEKADRALYKSKREGKNQFNLYNEDE
jgi:diguanylate cyclase (GGDEF)-like protein